jgi:hypothetical protein
MASAPARDPGAPIGKDEIDPDLVSLRRTAPKVGIVTSAAIVILCVVLAVRLRDDFSFAHGGDTPRTVSVADVIAGKIDDNTYVSLVAPLERSAAVRARVTEANAGTRVVPVRGSSDKLWIALPGDAWAPVALDDVVTGRLRALSDVRFAGTVASYAAKHPAPRFASGAALRQARTGGGAVPLVGGGTYTLAPSDEIELSIFDPGAAVVVATFNPRLPTVKAWTEALVTAGVLTATDAPTRTTDETARWELRRADAVASITTAIDGAQLWGARAEPASIRFRTAWSALATTDAGITTPSGVMPWSAIDVAAIWAPRPVPAGAHVLLVDEKPGAYWYLTPVYVGLALFAALFTWALVLAVRRARADAKQPPAPAPAA